VARHAATDRSSIGPDREGLGPNTRRIRRLLCHEEKPTKAFQRALTASGRKSGRWQPTTAFATCSAACFHDLAVRARIARTSAATSRRLATAEIGVWREIAHDDLKRQHEDFVGVTKAVSGRLSFLMRRRP
jgi:hypothetical protein